MRASLFSFVLLASVFCVVAVSASEEKQTESDIQGAPLSSGQTAGSNLSPFENPSGGDAHKRKFEGAYMNLEHRCSGVCENVF
jgi:hypothetical protein